MINNSDFRKFAMDQKYRGSYISGNTFDAYQQKLMNPMMGWQNPQVIEQSVNGVSIDIFSRMMQDRIIYLGTEIDETVGNIITSQLLYLNSVSNEDPISIYINSPGGSVVDGLMVYDALMYIEPCVSTTVCGSACSMASVILAAGDEGKRYAQKHSRVMIHEVSSGMSGKISDMEISFRETEKLNKELFQILADHTHNDIDKIYELASRKDHWMNSAEALQFGIIDKVLEPKKKNPSAND